LIITQAAEDRIKTLCEEHNSMAARPFVSGSGCSGMTHGITFAEEKYPLDRQLTPHLLIDPIAFSYMSEATMDYDTSGMSPRFSFENIFSGMKSGGACGGCGNAG
jgi:iron-sulfur cluster assembly accessory protein